MEKRNMGKRVSRSQKAIKEAFIRLLDVKSYESITVQNIIEESGYSKGTFYAHYLDKFDLTDKFFRLESMMV